MRLFSCSLYVCVQHRLPLERFKNIPCPAQCRHSAHSPTPPSHTTARVVVLLRMLQKLRVDVASAISKAFRGNQSQASSGCNSSTASRKTKLCTGQRGKKGGGSAMQCSHVQVKLLSSRHFCRSHCIFSIIWRNFTAQSGNRNCFLALPITALKGINLCSPPWSLWGEGWRVKLVISS